ncbi:MFS general substrate transporter [Meredithblackwellia eburnea MCA 4105]
MPIALGSPVQSAPGTRRSSITLVQPVEVEAGEQGLREDEEKDVEEKVTIIISSAKGPSYPDGGLQAWMVVAGGTLIQFSTFGMSNSFGAFQAQYKAGLLAHRPPSDISWIGSVHLCLLFLFGLPSGRLFDDGYFRYQIAIGSVLWIIGIFMLSLSTTYTQIFLSQGVCLGVGLGILFSPNISCVGSYFLKKRSLVLGCVAAGAAAGATIFPILLNHLVPKIGFAGSVRVIGYIQTACLIAANLLMRPRDLPRKEKVPVLPQIAAFLREPSTWLVNTGSALIMLGLFIPLFYIQVFASSHGASPWVVEYSLALINATALFSRLLGGILADGWGIFNTALPVTFGTGTLIFIMLAATTSGGVIGFALAYGLLSGAWVTIMAPGFLSLAENVNELGVRAGLGFLFVSVSVLIGNPIAGAILTASGEYWAVCVFGGGSVFLGTVFLFFGRRTQTRRKGTWRV